MDQAISESHYVDKAGNPAGGYSQGCGISVKWQEGPLGRGPDRKEPNGAFVEGVLQTALGRLRFYQTTKFKCEDTELAVMKIEEAFLFLIHRTREREQRGVEGTHEV